MQEYSPVETLATLRRHLIEDGSTAACELIMHVDILTGFVHGVLAPRSAIVNALDLWADEEPEPAPPLRVAVDNTKRPAPFILGGGAPHPLRETDKAIGYADGYEAGHNHKATEHAQELAAYAAKIALMQRRIDTLESKADNNSPA